LLDLFRLDHGNAMQGSHALKNALDDLENADLERIERLLEWAKLIHKDIGDFIGFLDRFYIEKKAAEKPSMKDFLTI